MWLFRRCFGGHSGRETPGPIPNPEAKPASADGTAPARVRESRTPPNNNVIRAGGTTFEVVPPAPFFVLFSASVTRSTRHTSVARSRSPSFAGAIAVLPGQPRPDGTPARSCGARVGRL